MIWICSKFSIALQLRETQPREETSRAINKNFEMGVRVEIKVTARHGNMSDEIQETMKAKVSKLPKFFDRTTAIQVLVDLEHTDTPKVEIIVSAEETNDFFASDTGSNVLVALDSTVSKMEQQLKKHKEKLISHRGRDHKIPEESAE